MSSFKPWRKAVDAEKVADHRITKAIADMKSREARFLKGEEERREFNEQRVEKLKNKHDSLLAEP